MRAHVYTQTSPWPDAQPGTIAAVHCGDYRRQEIWVACGSNVGNWYPLGNQYGNQALKDPTVPQHPHWEDIVARGPVTILVATSQDAYRSGWADGRKELFEQVEQMYEDGPTTVPDAAPANEPATSAFGAAMVSGRTEYVASAATGQE